MARSGVWSRYTNAAGDTAAEEDRARIVLAEFLTDERAVACGRSGGTVEGRTWSGPSSSTAPDCELITR